LPTITTSGDISLRTKAFVVAKMLKNMGVESILDKFGQPQEIPKNNSKAVIFRRYLALAHALTPLTEGVTPRGVKPKPIDYTTTLEQYGDFVEFSDVIQDTHEDPILRTSSDLLSVQATETFEILRWQTLIGGTNVFFANGTSRDQVNTLISRAKVRAIVRTMKAQRAKTISKAVKSSPDFGTENVSPAYIAVCHTFMEIDIRNMEGFIDVKDYGPNTQPYPYEIGAVESARFLCSPLFEGIADAGGLASTNSVYSTSGVNADIFSVLFIGTDAYGTLSLKGSNGLNLLVSNPKPAAGDPLAQRGTVGWKTYMANLILNHAWIARLECAVSA
jgi:N4-gp56 family major capsid protein